MSQQPAWLHCQGTKGELTLKADEQNKSFQLAIIEGDRTTLILIDAITASQAQANPDVRVTSFKYDDPRENFVSIDASFVQPHWFPPIDRCQPTRVPGQCQFVHRDGYWGSISSHEVVIGFKVNPTNEETYILNVLRAEPYGIGGIDQNPIGENVLCKGQLL